MYGIILFFTPIAIIIGIELMIARIAKAIRNRKSNPFRKGCIERKWRYRNAR